jgi:hypothetical protein
VLVTRGGELASTGLVNVEKRAEGAWPLVNQLGKLTTANNNLALAA